MNVLEEAKKLGNSIKDSQEFKEYKEVESRVISSPNTIDLLDRFNGVQELLKDYIEAGKFEEASKLKDEMNHLYDDIIDNDLLNQLSVKLDKVNRLRDQVFSIVDTEISVILKPPRIKVSSGCSGCSNKSDDGCGGC